MSVYGTECATSILAKSRLRSAPMSSFTDFLLAYTASSPGLPLVHSTSFQNFRSILRSHVLSPTPCTVFEGEVLLYLFYGKPSYRVSNTVTSEGQLRHLPVCFVLSPQSISVAKRIYPFDSGAFSGGLFSQFLKGLELDDFAIEDFPEGPRRFVSAFYGNNRNYYFGEVLGNVNASALEFEVAGYLDMLRDTAVTYAPTQFVPSDDRRQTMEIQSDSVVDLKPEALNDPNGTSIVRNRVLAVILPQRCLDVPEIRDAVTTTWKAEPVTYNIYNSNKPYEYHSVIREKVAELLLRHNLM